MVNEISTSNGQPVIFVPLVFIVLVTAAKDLFEDISRRNSDKQENESSCWRLEKTGLEEVHWEDL